MMASVRILMVIGIICRFMALSLFSIKLLDVSGDDGGCQTARHCCAWIRNLDLECVAGSSKVLRGDCEIKRTAPRTSTDAFLAGARENSFVAGYRKRE